MCAGVLAGVLLAGCSGGDGALPDAPEAGASEESGAPEGGGGLDFVLDPDRVPQDVPAAVELVRAVTADPEAYGPDYVAQEPAETDPAGWAVLDADCAWQREPLPDGVLASLTRYAELPAEDGAGPVRVSAVVTVHRDTRGAEWEMARSVEDALRCPDQQLRTDEWVTGLLSLGFSQGTLGNDYAEDFLTEAGEFHSDVLGGPHTFEWTRGRLGPVTFAVSARGAEGRTPQEISEAGTRAAGSMATRIQQVLEADEEDRA
ncbi:hypothetical protein PJ985_03215 [Streptomyces sp. ACA25]|uniref:hypothetical protein n=1 Tax=Streptomyces sp. ACA25 TaxID=3022596 RepID=UPI002307E31F|nr:hypothetical protein [Streptomyces sp. ACA25]MDB1086576.1 hypothetical protein [Streptomyces sp. ACA25]